MHIIRYLLFVTALMIVSNTYAQNTVSGNEQFNNIEIGLFYSLDTNLSEGNIELSDESGYRTKYNRNNFTAGLNLQYVIIKNWALQSGLNYAKRDFSGTFYCNLCDFLIPPEQEAINLQFVQIPAVLKYSNYFNNLGFFGKIGVLNQLLAIEPDNYELEANSYSLSGILETGIKYYFGHGFSTALAVNYTDGVTKVFEEANYSYRTLGIQLNLSIEL